MTRPRSLRTRVALLFVLAVAVTAAAMIVSAFFITKRAQESDVIAKAVAQTRFNLFLADSLLPADPSSSDYDRLLNAYAIRGDFETLIRSGGDTYVSGPQVTSGLITVQLAAKVAQGRVGYQMVTSAAGPALAVGGLARQGGPSVYFFYPQSGRLADLARLRNVLITAGVILAILAALAGYWVAGWLMRPVRKASNAAALMAGGDLQVRLPEGADEFGVLGASFNLMAGSLQARMSDLEDGQARERRFVQDVAHELRTPLAALVGEASLLGDRARSGSGLPQEMTRLVTLVEKDTGRLRQLVDDLLEIGRLDARAVEATAEPVELADFVTRMVRAHGWESHVVVGPVAGPVRIETDKRLLERILVNLVQNALHHGSPPVSIALGAQPPLITVSDNGPGVRPEHLPHIFDRFYKADASRSSAGGSGLGLAIARANARLLGGDLRAENLPGRGARFTLTLPGPEPAAASTPTRADPLPARPPVT